MSRTDGIQSATSESPTIRLFTAIRPDPDVQAGLLDLTDRLQKAAQFTPLRPVWTLPENLHVTLHFLGNLEIAKVDALTAQLKRAASEAAPFVLDYRHVGFFPNEGPEPPRMLWVRIHRVPPELGALRAALGDGHRRLGLNVTEKVYTPHVTIARLKSAKGVKAFGKILRAYEFVKLGKQQVGSIWLMKSETGGGPARYEPVAEFPIGTKP